MIKFPPLAKLLGPVLIKEIRGDSIWLPSSESRKLMIEQSDLEDCDINDSNEITSRKDKKVIGPGDERYDRIVRLARRAAENGPHMRHQLGD